MTTFHNHSKGIRGILLKSGRYCFVQPGARATVPGHQIKVVPQGMREIDPEAEGDALEVPADFAAFDHDGDGHPGGSKPNDLPALSGMTKDQLVAQAALEGVDVEAIEGSGADGNVLVADLKAAIEAKRGE